MTSGLILYSFDKDNKIHYGLYFLAKNDYDIIYISYTAYRNWFDKRLLEVKDMIHSIKFNLQRFYSMKKPIRKSITISQEKIMKGYFGFKIIYEVNSTVLINFSKSVKQFEQVSESR